MRPNTYVKDGVSKSKVITFRSFGDFPMSPVVVLLSGGPGLSSKYLDPFAETLSAALKQRSIVLDYPDHESYNSNTFLDEKSFESMNAYLEEALNALTKDGVRSVSLVAHSYGASHALRLLRRAEKLNLELKRTVLLAPVFATYLSQEYRDAASSVVGQGYNDFKSEEGFRAYWGRLLPLYFSSAQQPGVLEDILSETTWVENEAFATELGYEELSQIDDSQVYVVSGGADFLVDKTQTRNISRDLKERASTVENGGHFFMIENPAASAEHLMQNVFIEKIND